MLVAAGVDRVLTMTLHAPQVHGFFSVPVDHLTAIGVLAEHFRDHDLANSVVVSPTSATPRPPPSSPGSSVCPRRQQAAPR